MSIQVLYFASLKEALGPSGETVEPPAGVVTVDPPPGLPETRVSRERT